MVYFKINSNGKEYIGAVQGNGGTFGAGTAYQGKHREREAAVAKLQRCIGYVNEYSTMPKWAYEPQPGCCLVIPPEVSELSFEDGRKLVQVVPLAGATFELKA